MFFDVSKINVDVHTCYLTEKYHHKNRDTLKYNKKGGYLLINVDKDMDILVYIHLYRFPHCMWTQFIEKKVHCHCHRKQKVLQKGLVVQRNQFTAQAACIMASLYTSLIPGYFAEVQDDGGLGQWPGQNSYDVLS